MFLLGVPALPLPTGGATHVFEILAVLLAAQLIAGRDCVWLPKRWRDLELAGERQQRFITGLMRMIRRLERLSRPRLRPLFGHRLSDVVFGLLVIAGTVGAFLAPPFSGLDTLPALGVVLLSLAVLLEDFLVVTWGCSSAPRGSCSRSCSARPRSTLSKGSSRGATGAAAQAPAPQRRPPGAARPPAPRAAPGACARRSGSPERTG